MNFIPIAWGSDPAIYSEEEMPDPNANEGSLTSLEALENNPQTSQKKTD